LAVSIKATRLKAANRSLISISTPNQVADAGPDTQRGLRISAIVAEDPQGFILVAGGILTASGLAAFWSLFPSGLNGPAQPFRLSCRRSGFSRPTPSSAR